MKYFKKAISVLLITGLAYSTQAQTVVAPEKRAYVDSLNRYYIQTEQPVYLYLSTKPNDPNPTPIPNSNSGTVVNEVKPMFMDGNGVHTIQHYDAICHQRVIFHVHADGVAPVTKNILKGTGFIINKTQYYGNDLTVSLTAKDDMSGVAQTYYSINGAPYQEYSGGTKISVAQGENLLRYYSVDHVGNMEKLKEKSFTIDGVAPTTYHTVTGIGQNNVISTNSVIYLRSSDAVSGIAKTYYKFDDGAELLYNGKSIPTQQLSEGDHTLSYYSVDQVGNKEIPRSLKFYLDKSGPIVATDILGDKFIINGQIYFSGRTKMKLTSVDNKIGVKETRYSINGGEFMRYTEPFYLPSRQGIHVVRYFAVDSLENTTMGVQNSETHKYTSTLEYTHTINKIYVDLTGPSLFYKYKGPIFTTRDTTFISSNTEIVLSGTDNESGLQKLAYSLDNNPTEIEYIQPVTIAAGGTHSMNIIGYDNVNNRNVTYTSFIVDNLSPVIRAIFSVDPIGAIGTESVYPPYVQIFMAPTDNLTGIDKITYSINGQPSKDYQRYIDGFQKEQKYEVKIIITDKLGNASEQTVRFHVKNKP